MKKPISKPLAVAFFSLLSAAGVIAQDDLLDFLNEQEKPVTDYTIATFKTTRVVSGHSVETNAKGVLQFLIGHRFGTLNTGWRDVWGLDNATIRLGLEYGITDNLNVGIGRSSFQKTYDGLVKWRFLRQKSGAENFPFTATWVSTLSLNTTEWANPERENFFTSRMAYTHGLLLAKKFGDKFSLQLMPTAVHRNLVERVDDQNTVFAQGIGTSLRLSGSVRLNLEYYYIPEGQIVSDLGGVPVRNALSVGVDLETGGHVFQLFFTNSRGMTEKFMVGETTGDWADGGIHFGFNVSRVFTVQKPKEFKH
jgi:opacity protein-like surface antigen